MWNKSIQIILKNPFFGSGASSFSGIYQELTGLYKYHSHNINLELMINYGLPAAFFTIIPISLILLNSWKKILQIKLLKKLLYDKSLITALFIIVLMHMVDIQYFDGRISITFWILIAAIKNIVINKEQKRFIND
jgi:O-antigen ligase